MKTNPEILIGAIEYLEDDTTEEPEKLQKTLIVALNAILGELEDIKQEMRGLAASE